MTSWNCSRRFHKLTNGETVDIRKSRQTVRAMEFGLENVSVDLVWTEMAPLVEPETSKWHKKSSENVQAT